MRFVRLLSLIALMGAAQLATAIELDPKLFPGIEKISDDELRLAGLAACYPGRVTFDAPELELLGSDHEAACVEELPRDVTYIRVYRLEEATTVLNQHRNTPSLIVDLRYLKSTSLGGDSLGLFAQAEWLPSIEAHGKAAADFLDAASSESTTERSQAVVILCNRETAGPFEATLEALQSNGAIMAVGEATAGHTGFYGRSGTAWILNGELLIEGRSLVGTGFQPRIEVPGTPEANYNSYHLYEAGTELKQLIRSEQPIANDKKVADKPKELDPVLQRGLEIVAALQILDR